MPARHRRGVAVLTGRAVGQHRLDTAGDLHRGVAVVRGGGPGPGLVRRQAGDARGRGVIGVAVIGAVPVLAVVARIQPASGDLPAGMPVAGAPRLGQGRGQPGDALRRGVRLTTPMPIPGRMAMLYSQMPRRARLHPRAALGVQIVHI